MGFGVACVLFSFQCGRVCSIEVMLKSFTHFYIFGNKKETVLSRTFPCPGTHKQKNNAGGFLAQVNVLYQALTFLITKGKDCYRTSLPR